MRYGLPLDGEDNIHSPPFVNGHCVTNLDGYAKEEWPSVFAKVPEKRDRVVAASGRHLAVVEVRHAMKYGKPYIIVELHR